MRTPDATRDFLGATAVITGAASGIGRSLAVELASRGCEVVLADLQARLAEQVASEIGDLGGRATSAGVDVTSFAAVEDLIQSTVERTGRLDYMFNNAGIALVGPASLHRIDDWNRVMDVNLGGVINGAQAAYRIMIRQGFGHIVNTASMAGLLPVSHVAYTTTKHAVVGLSQSLRVEAAHFGIRVSVLCPGFIRTPILEGGGAFGKTLIDIPPEKLAELWEKIRPMPPDLFARKAISAIQRNKAIIVLPSWYKIIWWMNGRAPSSGLDIGAREYENMQKLLGEAEDSRDSGTDDAGA